MTEDSGFLPLEEAQSEAIAVKLIQDKVLEYYKQAIVRAIDKSEGVKKTSLEKTLRGIDGWRDSEKLQLASTYLDDMKDSDQKEYDLIVELHEQVGRLDSAVGKERRESLVDELNHEKEQVSDRYGQQALVVQQTLFITDDAMTGEAISNMASRPSNKNIPTHAFGLLFSISLAQSKLTQHLTAGQLHSLSFRA